MNADDDTTQTTIGDWRPEELALVRAAERLAGDDRMTWRRAERLLALVRRALLTGG